MAMAISNRKKTRRHNEYCGRKAEINFLQETKAHCVVDELDGTYKFK